MTTSAPQIAVRDRAAARIPQYARESGGDDTTLLRLRVTDHDDSSICYTLRFDKTVSDADDVVLVSNGLSIVVDKRSASLVDGTEISYLDGAARLEQGRNPRKPKLDPALGILGTISVHALSPDQLWESTPLDDRTDGSPQHTHGEDAPHSTASPQFTVCEDRTVEAAEPPITGLTDAALTALTVEAQRSLNPDNGLKCVPRFWKAKLWQMIRYEPGDWLRRYKEEHLDFLKKYVEPLVGNSDSNAHAEFAALCREMAAAPNLAYVAARFGCEEPKEEEPLLWLQWAGTNEPDPAKCLYCVAGFVAVPPFAGDPPPIVGATISALSGLSLLRLGRPGYAAAVVESFLEITAPDYTSTDSLLAALRRSPLKELGALHTTTLRDTLQESLRAVSRHSHQALLARAFAEFERSDL